MTPILNNSMSGMLSPSIRREQQGDLEIVTLRGQFVGGKETDELRATLNEALHEQRRTILVDLSNVTYLNSTALGVLIAAHSSITKRGGKIALCGLSESLENIFVITKLSMVFDIYRDRDAAIHALSSSSTNL
ncbi:MAG: anti-sigma factor antagonist [Chlorobiota bacterium]|nr:MAG: anti-sigma factor antagonist [Chlorobiota bacterium]